MSKFQATLSCEICILSSQMSTNFDNV